MLGLANKPLGDIGTPGLRGQRMTLRAPTVQYYRTPGAYAFSAPASAWYDILLYGPGGDGGSTPGTAASGGGGGGAARKRVWLRRGEVVTGAVGAPGSPTTAALTGRFSFSATSGGAGATGFVAPGAGGVGIGGDANRTGGRGAGSTDADLDPNTNDGPDIAATDGEWGGKTGGGAGAGGGGPGGGAAGFTDILTQLAGYGGGNLSPASTGGSPGGGGAGGTVGYAGGPGAVAIIYGGG